MVRRLYQDILYTAGGVGICKKYEPVHDKHVVNCFGTPYHAGDMFGCNRLCRIVDCSLFFVVFSYGVIWYDLAFDMESVLHTCTCIQKSQRCN